MIKTKISAFIELIFKCKERHCKQDRQKNIYGTLEVIVVEDKTFPLGSVAGVCELN